MAKNTIENSPEQDAPTGVVSRSIVSEMKKSFIDYAMSVITDRALPVCVRRGLLESAQPAPACVFGQS